MAEAVPHLCQPDYGSLHSGALPPSIPWSKLPSWRYPVAMKNGFLLLLNSSSLLSPLHSCSPNHISSCSFRLRHRLLCNNNTFALGPVRIKAVNIHSELSVYQGLLQMLCKYWLLQSPQLYKEKVPLCKAAALRG